MRIAAWSGPRNLSTALMYAFAARGDFAVQDEPFYAPYLLRTGIRHPLRDAILARHEADPDRIVGGFGPGPGGNLYLKLMAQHMVAGVPDDWAADFSHLHLVRHPARVIASYIAKRETPTLEDIGLPRQLDLYERFGGIVVDSTDLRAEPRAMLAAVCEALGLDFTPRMLSWPSGGHPSDGAWAPHWYEAVHRSTRFAGREGEVPELQGSAANLCADAMAYYDTLCRNKLAVG